jgi:ATP-binding cassette, subfamily B, beta-glucan exporter
MTLTRIYRRAFAMLLKEPRLVAVLLAANVVLGIVQLAEPVLLGRVVDALAKRESVGQVVTLWAALGLTGIVGGMLVSIFADRMCHRRRMDAIEAAFGHGITLPLSFHIEAGSSRATQIVFQGADRLFSLWLTMLREHMAAAVSLIFLVPTALTMEPRLGLILGVLALFFAATKYFVISRTKSRQDAVEDQHRQLAGRTGDVFANVMVVQSYARFAQELSAFREMIGRILTAQYPVLVWWAVVMTMTSAASTAAMITVFLAGAHLSAAGAISIGKVVSFVGFASMLIAKMDYVSSFVTRVFYSAPMLAAYFELLDTPAEITDEPDAPPLPKVKGRVTFENVSFQYPGSSQGVFNLNLTAEPGETVALVGPTGAGKTTALALLQRLRDPDEGRICIDGYDIRRVTLQSLRQSIAAVFQDAGLFHRTIADNIRVGRPDSTDSDIEEAAVLAEAHEFISGKPNAYGFNLGERGAVLSGGERQRVAIARAILKDAPILVLDEATSALDTATEGKIKRALDTLRRHRTTFIIAHRLSTVANADKIVVMERGRVAEAGRYDELVSAGGAFAKLVAAGGFTHPANEAKRAASPAEVE